MAQTYAQQQEIPQKATVHLTDRQLKYLAARADGMKRGDAVKAAGYGDNIAPAKVEESPNLRRALQLAMEAAGLTTEKLAEKIRAGIDAKKVNYYAFKGEVVDERVVEDSEIQHKYVRTALEVRGDLSEGNEVNVNIGLVEIPGREKTADLWNDSEVKDAV